VSGKPYVHENEPAIRVRDYVSRLDVTMDDSLLPKCFDSLANMATQHD
jgi:hypothetical protein